MCTARIMPDASADSDGALVGSDVAESWTFRSRSVPAERRPFTIQVSASSSMTGASKTRCRRTEPKDRPRAVGALWDFSGTSAPSTGTSVQQSKGHSRRSAGRSPLTQQVTGLPGLFRDLTSRKQQLRPERRPPSTPHRHSPSGRGLTCPAGLLTPHQIERHSGVKISPVMPTPHIIRTRKTAGREPIAAGSRIATHSTWRGRREQVGPAPAGMLRARGVTCGGACRPQRVLSARAEVPR